MVNVDETEDCSNNDSAITNLPQYSVLMSVYKGDKPEWLRASMESMFSQTVKTDDFVLVCDGDLTNALDDTISFFEQRENSLRVIRLDTNQGLGKALEIGLPLCKNELVARMDSDDISIPDRIEKQLRVFKESTADVVGGAIAEFDDSPERLLRMRKTPAGGAELLEYAKLRSPMNHVSVMFKKSKVLLCGGYRELPFAEDYYLWVRMLANGSELINIPEALVYVRAGDDMYKRRSGLIICKSQIKIATAMYRLGLLNKLEFLRNISVRVCGSVAPAFLRKAVYEKRFRENITD